MKEINIMANILLNHSVIGVIGNRSTGKTLTCLTLLESFKNDFKNKNIAILGVEKELKPICDKLGFLWISNKMDILDLQLKNTLIYIAEFGILFNIKNQSVLMRKLKRFFDRLDHNKCKIIMDTARQGFYNKFMCNYITSIIVKEIEYDSLVNGTWINERIKAQDSISDYRLQIPINQYVVMSNKGEPTSFYKIKYNSKFDSKSKTEGFFTDDEIKKLTENLT